MTSTPSEARKRVLRNKIVRRLRDMKRHLRALEAARAEFGEDFDLDPFESAFASEEPDALNRVAAVERNVDRLYNYMVEITAYGLELAAEREEEEKPNAPRDLRRLQRLGALTQAQTNRLIAIQGLRRAMVHDYPETSAAEVHELANTLIVELPGFQQRVVAWVKRYYDDPEAPASGSRPS